MTHNEYKDQDAERQWQQNKLTSQIQKLADNRVNPPASLAEAEVLYWKYVEADAALTEQRAQEHADFCAQAHGEEPHEA